jgi:Flp pilus assembly protein TadG
MTRPPFARIVRSLPARWAQLREQAEAGFVSLYVVVTTIGLLAIAGLVIDGGNAITAREQAVDTARQGSRAGAALSPDSLRGSSNKLSASPAAAQAAANRVLQTAGLTGSVSVDGDNVTVTVVVHRSTTILSAFGLNDISGRATATATALHGTTIRGNHRQPVARLGGPESR